MWMSVPDDQFADLELTWSSDACADPSWLGAKDAPVIGHMGFVNAYVVGDCGTGLVVVFASNTVHRGEVLLRRLYERIVRGTYATAPTSGGAS